MSRYRPSPSESFDGQFFDPRVGFFDQPRLERERMRDNELRSRPHHQHPNYQVRDRSPVDFPRFAPRWDDYNRDAPRPEGFGFVAPYDDRFVRDDQPSSSRRGSGKGCRCGETGFYFYCDDGFCYDEAGYSYQFEQDGFYYDTETGYRHDSGGFLCDENGVRLNRAELESYEQSVRFAHPIASVIGPIPPRTEDEPIDIDIEDQEEQDDSRRGGRGSQEDLVVQKKKSRRVGSSTSSGGVHTEFDSGQIERDNGRTQYDRGRIECDSGRIKCDSSRIECDSGRIKCDSSRIEGDSSRIEGDSSHNRRERVQAVTAPLEGLSLPGSSGAQPLSVPKSISDEILLFMTSGISTDSSKAISKEFCLDYVDVKPPKLDGWISRRVLLKSDKNLIKSINAKEETLIKAQLKIMDIGQPLVDLYTRLSSLPDNETIKRPVQAALQQWGRAYFSITRERRSAVVALAEPSADYLLKEPDAFDTGKEARVFLLTDKFLQVMLNNANQDNTLAQASKAAAAAAAANATRRPATRRVRAEPPSSSSHPPPRYESDVIVRGGRGGRSRRAGHGRGQRSVTWFPGSRRYVTSKSNSLTPCKIFPSPDSKP
ncbi:LOW QUALITY PROTEIN: hypothetical protein DAPPUDRAFT_239751 [Daphnia pulex]|uniref:Uncharacterized protein n=1 Tax=Daphnia pulex TaxID=6669 RepID=E9G9Z6_DAPPU|nr:LOW QUALITY PROTEIN: hypothetical protein DAPPUDRAFT_239751 [Daphnia pulex]|eukprot:EFX83654.1 LOW QUALITY PROTEIN: hypothetical protein DAPPUDRAFT_239751 [Daphnia pulex]